VTIKAMYDNGGYRVMPKKTWWIDTLKRIKRFFAFSKRFSGSRYLYSIRQENMTKIYVLHWVR